VSKKVVIHCTLDTASIDAAIKQIEDYKDSMEAKAKKLHRRIAERIGWTASAGFHSALVSDVIHGPPEQNDVYVTVKGRRSFSVVIAEGERAVFIEFGSGRFNNGAPESSPHPLVSSPMPGTDPLVQTFTIGSYGKGQGGTRNAWGYYIAGDKANGVVITRGTPAAMPMYRGMQEAIASIADIAREVFGFD